MVNIKNQQPMLRFDKAVMIKLNKTKALQWQMRL